MQAPAAGAGSAAWVWKGVGRGELSQLSEEDTSWKMDLPRDTGPTEDAAGTRAAGTDTQTHRIESNRIKTRIETAYVRWPSHPSSAAP